MTNPINSNRDRPLNELRVEPGLKDKAIAFLVNKLEYAGMMLAGAAIGGMPGAALAAVVTGLARNGSFQDEEDFLVTDRRPVETNCGLNNCRHCN